MFSSEWLVSRLRAGKKRYTTTKRSALLKADRIDLGSVSRQRPFGERAGCRISVLRCFQWVGGAESLRFERDEEPAGRRDGGDDKPRLRPLCRRQSTRAWASFISVGWKAPNRLVPRSLSICDLNTLRRYCSQGPFLLLVIVLF